MPCYHPVEAWRSKYENVKTGKRSLVFGASASADPDEHILVPCGQCIGCRLERSRQWATRCVHEASLYDENAFITLTYDPEFLPSDGGLVKHHFTDFMKRLRKHYAPRKIRYYMCGEYGELCRVCSQSKDECKRSSTDHVFTPGLGRPHFHACLFNLDFADKELYTVRDDIRIYTSPVLEKIWGKGFVTIGEVTFESAAYVARYIAKKITGDQADSHYWKMNYETGELYEVRPEYNNMSLRPGIGADWWREFRTDTKKDFITVRGAKQRPPKYYDKLMEDYDPQFLELVKEDRKFEAFEQFEDNSPARLKVKERIKLKKYSQLPRNLE